MQELFDVIVIGSGPAGMSAALFLKRSNANVCLIEKGMPGGKLVWTSAVENYPGFKASTGVDLAQIMYQQMIDENVTRLKAEVLDIIRLEDGSFNVITSKDSMYAKFVIFAAGSKVRSLGVKGEERFKSKGLSYCAICDGSLYENEDVVVIGGGTSGFEEALYLSKICKGVTLISRSETYKAPTRLVEKASHTRNITLLNNKQIEEFIGDKYLEGVLIKDKITGFKEVIQTHGAFIYIGFDPTSSMLEKYGVLDEKGYIYVDEGRETNVPRLYAAGDCIHKTTRQVITAVADGVIAAVGIIRKL